MPKLSDEAKERIIIAIARKTTGEEIIAAIEHETEGSGASTTDGLPEGSVNKYFTEERAANAAPVQSVNTKTGDVVLTKSDVGLSNVDNTSDADKPISDDTQDALDLKADTDHVHDLSVLTQSGAANGQVPVWNGTAWAPASVPAGEVAWGDITGDIINQTDLQNALDEKFNNPTGTVSDYIAGDGSVQPFPTITTASNLTTEVYNKTGSQINKFQVVYINGGQGNLPSVTLAQANSESASSKTYGVVQADISDMNNGYVLAQGRIENIDTAVYGGTEGTSLWLSPTVPGGVTITKPSAPNHMVFVGTIIRSHPTQGVVEVKIQNGFELEELHNVAINSGTLANNDTIVYDSATQLWKNSGVKLTKGTKTIFCIDNGDFATGQAAIDAATANSTILFGVKTGGWGDLVIPAGKKLSLKGLVTDRSTQLVQVGSITFSPTTGLNINENELYIDSLFISNNTATVVTFGGTAPARIRLNNCYIYTSGSSNQTCVFSNSSPQSSWYIKDCGVNSTNSQIMIQSSVNYGRIHDSDADCNGIVYQNDSGTVEVRNSILTSTSSGVIVNILAGSALTGYSQFTNNGANSSGIAVAAGAIFANSYNSYSIPAGTGYCVRGTGVHVYGQMVFANSALAAYNVKVQSTLTNIPFTTSFTLSP
jgi:hypothetical protein